MLKSKQSELNSKIEHDYYTEKIFKDDKLRSQFKNTFAESLDYLSNFPANINAAKFHDLATSFGKKDRNVRVKYCHCCFLPVQKKKYGMMIATTPDYIWPKMKCFNFQRKNHDPQQQLKENILEVGKFSLDSGTAMYFTFIKMLIIYLILRFLIVDLYNIIQITQLSSQESRIPSELQSSVFFVWLSSFYEVFVKSNIFLIEDILSLIWVVLSILYFSLYRRMLFRINEYSMDLQADEFTILVQNIPTILPEDSLLVKEKQFRERKHKFEYMKVLEDYFNRKIVERMLYIDANDYFQQNDVRNLIYRDFIKTLELEIKLQIKERKLKIVTAVTPCYNLEQIENIRNYRDQLIRKHQAKSDQERKDDQTTIEYLKLLNKSQVQYGSSIFENQQLNWHLAHFTGKAFVTFQYSHFKYFLLNDFDLQKHKPLYEGLDLSKMKEIDEYLKEKYGKGREVPKLQKNKQYTIFENELQIESAAKPVQIDWINMKVSTESRRKNIIISFVYLVLMLGSIFAFLLALDKAKQSIQSSEASKQATLLGFILTTFTSILVFAVNYALKKIVQYLTDDEQHQNLSECNISLIVKIVVTQFVNSSMLFLIIAIFLQDQTQIITSNGIISSITSSIVQYGFLDILTNFLVPLLIKKVIPKDKNCGVACDVSSDIGSNVASNVALGKHQITLNKAYEKPQFELVVRFSYYILQFMNVSFYGGLSPIIVLVTIFVFIMQYWVDKYMLFNTCSSRISLDFKVNRLIFKIFQCSLVVFAIGNWLTAWLLLQRSNSIFLILAVIVSGLYLAVIVWMPEVWEKRIFGNLNKIITKYTYSTCISQKYFSSNYWSQNPATKYVTTRSRLKQQQASSNDNEYQNVDMYISQFQAEEVNDSYEMIEMRKGSRGYLDAMFEEIQENNTYAKDRFCPFFHRLKVYELSKDLINLKCDVCQKRVQQQGASMNACPLCSFHVCDQCITKPQLQINKHQKRDKEVVMCKNNHECRKVKEDELALDENPCCSTCMKDIFAHDDELYRCSTCNNFQVCSSCAQK